MLLEKEHKIIPISAIIGYFIFFWPQKITFVNFFVITFLPSLSLCSRYYKFFFHSSCCYIFSILLSWLSPSHLRCINFSALHLKYLCTDLPSFCFKGSNGSHLAQCESALKQSYPASSRIWLHQLFLLLHHQFPVSFVPSLAVKKKLRFSILKKQTKQVFLQCCCTACFSLTSLKLSSSSPFFTALSCFLLSLNTFFLCSTYSQFFFSQVQILHTKH